MTKKVSSFQVPFAKGEILKRFVMPFKKGAEEAGYQVEKSEPCRKATGILQGCLSCQETRHCILHDDAEAITAEMKASDVIVFASPVYYYGLTGQLKTLLDRANPLFASDYKFRDIYFLASAAEEGAKTRQDPSQVWKAGLNAFPKRTLQAPSLRAA